MNAAAAKAPALRRLNFPVLTMAHVHLLRSISSPVILAARQMWDHSHELQKNLATLESEASKPAPPGEAETMERQTIESLYILLTPFHKLGKLKKMDRATLTRTALAAIVPPISETELSQIQRAIGRHFADGLVAIGKQQLKT